MQIRICYFIKPKFSDPLSTRKILEGDWIEVYRSLTEKRDTHGKKRLENIHK